jgi:hypothetical protein
MTTPVFDPARVTLGKKPVRFDKRTLKYGEYRRASAIPAPPAASHWGGGIGFTMLGNDQYGDCVEAGFCHADQAFCNFDGGPKYVPTDAMALGAYSAITGFNQNDPSTDQGTDMLSACNYWRQTGITYPNGVTHKVDAFMSVSPQDELHIREAIKWYGGAYVGIQMPLSAQGQVGPGGPHAGPSWDVTSGPDSQAGSWGGHCVWMTAYTSQGLNCVTWGQLQNMSWDFFETYCDEAYVFLSPEWRKNTGLAPSGLSYGLLTADLNQVTN